MPVLGPDDPLGFAPRRILVAGTSGSGKTTLARRLAAQLDVPYVEIDALFHGPGWSRRSEFLDDVDALVARPEWITEWQYNEVRERLAARAELVVWLDLPRAVVMTRVCRRTLRRRIRRERLWNGNREGPLWRILIDREHIIRWAWSTHTASAQRVRDLAEARPELAIVRLRCSAESRRWHSSAVDTTS